MHDEIDESGLKSCRIEDTQIHLQVGMNIELLYSNKDDCVARIHAKREKNYV